MSKSRGEELLEALVNEEDSDIKPQSRMEEYLLAAIRKSGTDGLPKPISRGDALLHQLVDVVSNSSGGGEDEVNISESTTPSKDLALTDFTQLGHLSFPNATGVREKAFYACTNLTSIDLPVATDIGNSAFQDCTNLTSINLPEAIYIRNETFRGCTNLISVDLPSTKVIAVSTFSGCTNLTSIDLPVATGISIAAFSGCTNLTSIVLPMAMQIDKYALHMGSSTNKATITFLGTTPPTIDAYAFNKSYLNKIIVPAGCGDAYKSATNWSNFADYIEEATT